MYQELEDLVNSRGAILIYLPPYSPQLNPIETGFGLLKRYIQKHGNLAFASQPEYCLDIAFRECTKGANDTPLHQYYHAGYKYYRLDFNQRV
jgi:hypothetical protein